MTTKVRRKKDAEHTKQDQEQMEQTERQPK